MSRHTDGFPACAAARKDGMPCGMHRLSGSPYCWSHDPGAAQERAEARRRGGQSAQRRLGRSPEEAYLGVTLHDIPAVRRLLEIAAEGTLALGNSAVRNRTLASIATVAVRVFEAGEVEVRISALEQRLAEREAPAWATHA